MDIDEKHNVSRVEKIEVLSGALWEFFSSHPYRSETMGACLTVFMEFCRLSRISASTVKKEMLIQVEVYKKANKDEPWI